MRSVALALLLLATPAAAQVRLDLRCATDLRRPDGRTLFVVDVENAGRDLQGRLVLEQDGVPRVRRVERPVQLAAGARRRFFLPLTGSPGSEDFTLRLQSGGEVLARAETKVRSTGWVGLFAGSLGPAPRWLRAERSGLVGVAEVDPRLLPGESRAWPDVDLLVWPAARTTELDATQAAALRTWVERGGRLLAGRADDEPRAMLSLGWPCPAGDDSRWQPVGLGAVACSGRDLAREAPEAVLSFTHDVQAYEQNASFASAPLLSLMLGLVLERGEAPEVPLAGVVAVLGGWLLLGGPVESWLLRRRPRDGRRRRRAWPRRMAWLTAATVAILVLTGALKNTPRKGLRIDLVDLAEDGGAARGRTLILNRERSAGWATLSAGPDDDVRPLHVRFPQWRGGATGSYRERDQVIELGTGARPLQRSVRTAHAAWDATAWQVDFEPDEELVALARSRLAAAREETPLPEGWAWARSDSLRPTYAFSNSCLPEQHAEPDALEAARCAAFSCRENRPPNQHLLAARQAAPPWPEGARALVFARIGSLGPELQLRGRRLDLPAYTIVRIRAAEGDRP